MNLKRYDLDTKNDLRPNTPPGIIHIIKTQLSRHISANKRIDEEGIVVRDMRGSVIPHPAIKIEIDSGKILCDLLSSYRRVDKR